MKLIVAMRRQGANAAYYLFRCGTTVGETVRPVLFQYISKLCKLRIFNKIMYRKVVSLVSFPFG